MEEYEYSINVKDIKPFMEYCTRNGYKKIVEYKQHRIVYKSNKFEHLIARFTTNDSINKKETLFDIKNVQKSSKNLKCSQESIPIIVTNENKKSIMSIISILDFEKCSDLKRKRLIYKKSNVIFEIDDYSKPKMKVVAIEGKKEEVDTVFNDICTTFDIK
jgi:adenylate cyclase class IV